MSIVLENIRFVVADTEEIKRGIYQLRYQVYAEEFGFEPPNPDKMERDEIDDFAIHLAALEDFPDGSSEVIGTIRMIPHSEKGFPLENQNPILDFSAAGESGPPPRATTVELSRLAATKKYRRRLNDGLFGVESYLKIQEGDVDWREDDERRKRPFIVLGLYKLTWQYAKQHGITHWYMFTERALYVTVKRFGYIFHPLAEARNYHGRDRIPYLGVLREIDQYLHDKKTDYYKELIEDLEPAFHPKF